MSKFKVGDKVRLNPESRWNDGSPFNPDSVDGEIAYIIPDKDLPINVKWGEGLENDYSESDLILVEGNKNEKPSPPFPDFDFKINLKGMTESEKKLAKDWLVEVANSRGMVSGILSEHDSDWSVNYFFICEENHYVTAVDNENSDHFNNHELPEIKLQFSKPEITGFAVDNSDKVASLEEEIEKLKGYLKDKEDELIKLK